MFFCWIFLFRSYVTQICSADQVTETKTLPEAKKVSVMGMSFVLIFPNHQNFLEVYRKYFCAQVGRELSTFGLPTKYGVHIPTESTMCEY